jgi:DNA mismatch endonuclease (patch repair protein)
MKPRPYILPKVAVATFCEENGFYTTAQRSYNMSRIRSKGTKPEKLLKKALWQAGVRYKTPKKPLPGKPDISLKKHKLVIFVDGAFWHGYDWENRKQAIHSNREFWIAKIERNRQRDREVNAFYRSKGWTVLRFWDFEVKGEVGACLAKVLSQVDLYNI